MIAALAELAEEHRARGSACYYDVRNRRFNPSRLALVGDVTVPADVERWVGVTDRRREELERMRAFAESGECLMQLVTAALDDRTSPPCGRCANCSGEILSSSVEPGIVRAAIEFLRRSHRPIEPRKQGIAVAERRASALDLGGRGLGLARQEGEVRGSPLP